MRISTACKRAFILQGFAAVILRSLAMADNVSVEDSDETKLSPQVERKLQEVRNDLRDKKINFWNTRIQTQIGEIVKLDQLDQRQINALIAAAAPILNSCGDDWASKAERAFRTGVEKVPGEDSNKEMDILSIFSMNPDSLVQDEMFIYCNYPLDSEAWVKAIHSTLTPAQAAIWDKDQATKNQELDKKLDQALAPYLKEIGLRQTSEATLCCSVIEATLGLSSDRKEKLEKIAREAVTESSEQWAHRLKSSLGRMDEPQRATIIANCAFMGAEMKALGIDLADEFILQPKWKTGVNALLTADELKKLHDLQQAHNTDRIRTMGLVLIALVDERVALNSDQRDRLLPLAERLVTGVSGLFPDQGINYLGATEMMFFKAAEQASDADLKPILDNAQIKRWRQLTAPGYPVTGLPPPNSESSTEPEYIEKAISKNLYEREMVARKQILETCALKADDVIRKVGIDSDRATRLVLAAHGYAEKRMATWKVVTEQQLRAQLSDVTPQNIDQHLESLLNLSTGFDGNSPVPATDGLWDKTLEQELTPVQMSAWHKEVEVRTAYRDEAVTALVLSDFDHVINLSDDQRKKLEPLIAKNVHDYSPDISKLFSDDSGVPWFLTMGFDLLPLICASQDEIQAILNPLQRDAWANREERKIFEAVAPGLNQQHVLRENAEQAQAAAQDKKASK